MTAASVRSDGDGAPSLERVRRGVDPPGDVPAEIFQAALGTFLAGERLDMQALAADVGIGRSTLYRKTGHRDALLGAVVWYLTAQNIRRALEAAGGLEGADRVRAVVVRFMHVVNEQPSFQRFLDAEPEAALRILTSKHGSVQRSLVALLAELLVEEEERGALKLTIDPQDLAYVIVRVGESFLYADVIADNEPDLDLAGELVGRLLRETPSD